MPSYHVQLSCAHWKTLRQSPKVGTNRWCGKCGTLVMIVAREQIKPRPKKVTNPNQLMLHDEPPF